MKHLLVVLVAGGFAAMQVVRNTVSDGSLSTGDLAGGIGVFVVFLVIGEIVLVAIHVSQRQSPGGRRVCAACGFENSRDRKSCKSCRQSLAAAE